MTSAANPSYAPVPPASDDAPSGRRGKPQFRSLLGQAIYDTFGDTGARIGAIWIAFIAVIAVFAPFIANTHPFILRLKGGGLEFPLFRHLQAVDLILLMVFVHSLFVIVRKPGSGLVLALIFWPIAVIGIVTAIIKFGLAIVTISIYRPATVDPSTGLVLGWVICIVIHLVLLAIFVVGAWTMWIATKKLAAETILDGRHQALWISAAGLIGLSLAAIYTVRPPTNVIYERYRDAERAGQVETIVRTIIPYSANDRLRDTPEDTLTGPSRRHWLGTTNFSENMLSRMIHACRVTLAIGLIATSISTMIGIVIGGLMGYYAGWLDLIGMRLIEIFEAIPTLVLLLIVTVAIGRNLYLIMVVIGLLSWMSDARFIRAEFLRIRKLDYVQAAVAAGLGRMSIIFRHMLPNGVSPVFVNASFGIAGAILLESTLSFLGLGLGAEDPSWGQLLNQARSGGTGFVWWIAVFPGFAIFLTVFSYILIGEAMRDAIDPKLKKAQ